MYADILWEKIKGTGNLTGLDTGERII